jgi:ABC-type nickel/cobalt efflux system permease component RcnA
MKNIYKVIILLLLSSKIIFACSLCAIQVPTIQASVNQKILNDEIILDIKWVFDKKFTNKTTQFFPKNSDLKFELEQIKESLERYIKEYNYLMAVTYGKNKKFIPKDTTKSSFTVEFNKFVYRYSIKTNIKKDENKNLNIKFYDERKYFIFYFNNKDIKIEENQTSIKDDFIALLSKSLKQTSQKIKNLLKEINISHSPTAYFWLLFFSFIYGIIHAIGPGHGKTLVGSYFLQEKSSLLKALGMSTLIGVVHTFSAFILTIVIFYGVSVFLGGYFKDVEAISLKISAVIIILIALYLIFQKIRKSKNNHQHSCECSGCKTNSTDISVVLAAGIVPCPGTVTMFIYTINLGAYFLGFLSAIFMSLGMSVIIYITALLSIKVREKSSSNTILLKIFEYGSLLFILGLGLVLLLM